LRLRVLAVVEIQHGAAADDTDGNSRDLPMEWARGERPLRDQLVASPRQRHVTAGDRGGTCTAVRLQHVAIDRDRARSERLEIGHGAQRPADEALDLLRAAALLAARRFA